MYKRKITNDVLNSLQNSPVVFVNGARQVGKSTLVEQLIKKEYPADYITMDDTTTLFSATADANEFLKMQSTPLAIDEVQRVPDIFLPMKQIVDAQKQNGQYLLTGSANILTIPKVSESLAGRMIIYTLYPLSQCEIHNSKTNFIDMIFSGNFPTIKKQEIDINKMLVMGGYPRAIEIKNQKTRRDWFNSYISTILQRDIRDLANIEKFTELPNLLSLLAGRVGNTLNISDISRISGMSNTTLKRYYSLLKTVFLAVELPAWFSNREKRLVKSPKIFLNDTGLLCHLLNLDEQALVKDRNMFGHILENFVVMELMKQATWSNIMPKLHHFRTETGYEVDVVLEGTNGNLIGVEVKSSSTVNQSDFKGLKKLSEIVGDKLSCGIVLYTGDKILPFGKGFYALPIQTLWS